MKTLLEYLIDNKIVHDYVITPEGQVAIQTTIDSEFVLVIT